MPLTIILDPQPAYTNYDDVSGRVVLTCTRPEAVASITVKLEGEARAIDVAQDHALKTGSGADLPEVHKVLYKMVTVFPVTGQAMAAATGLMATGSYIFQPGRYEYPFRMRIPLTNSCSSRQASAPSVRGMLNGSGGSLRVADTSRHLIFPHTTKVLPPTLTGMHRAQVEYYVKATVQRPGLLRENWRTIVGITFVPVEPARPRSTTAQVAYARRPVTFQPMPEHGIGYRKPSLLQGFVDRGKTDSSPCDMLPPPSIVMTARLPHPLILTTNQPLGLSLVATKKTPQEANVRLSSIQADLVGVTHVACMRHATSETQRWVLFSAHNLAEPIMPAPDAPVDTAYSLDDRWWRDAVVPSTAVPSFETCNLSRTYSVEVHIGLSWGVGVGGRAQAMRLTLSFSSVALYSGRVAKEGAEQSGSRLAPSASMSTLRSPTAPPNMVPPPLPPRSAQARPGLGHSQSFAGHSPSFGHSSLGGQNPSLGGQNSSPGGQNSSLGGQSMSPQNVAPASPPPRAQDDWMGDYEEPPPSYDEAVADGARRW